MKRDNFGLINHINRINEIAVRNELHPLKVAGIYIKSNTKVYTGNLSHIGQSKYNLVLEDRVFDLTERYIDRQKMRELNRLERNEQVEKPYHISELIGEDKYNHYF